ncbi:MAG: MauE/DoxX family redox-associated membrane protein, partial [Acidimicrobiales bacterium]
MTDVAASAKPTTALVVDAKADRGPRLARWVLAALVLAMAAGQLSDPSGFVDIVATYRLAGGRTVATIAAALLIGGELVAGVGLAARNPAGGRHASTVALVVAVAWTLLGAQGFGRGLALDNCGCFGVHAGQQLRWWV